MSASRQLRDRLREHEQRFRETRPELAPPPKCPVCQTRVTWGFFRFTRIDGKDVASVIWTCGVHRWQ